jgi:hypothetical protein
VSWVGDGSGFFEGIRTQAVDQVGGRNVGFLPGKKGCAMRIVMQIVRQLPPSLKLVSFLLLDERLALRGRTLIVKTS